MPQLRAQKILHRTGHMLFLAHRIRISDILSCVRNSYLTHVILPRLSWEDCSLVVLELTHMVVKWRQCLVKVKSSCDIASQRIQWLLEAYFNIKSQWWARKRIHYLYEDGIEKAVPHDHRLSSLGKPCDAKQWSLGKIFLSHPHNQDQFL